MESKDFVWKKCGVLSKLLRLLSLCPKKFRVSLLFVSLSSLSLEKNEK